MDERLYGQRYRVAERIGTGGMADVFKAVDEVLGRTVAVKILHPRYAAEPTFAARFRQEAQAAANLQSPYIVNIYDWGQQGDTYFIVMEYVRGTDLKTMLERKGTLSAQTVAEIGAQVASALSVAGGYDVIHRDIKPHNIMVQPDGSVKVTDFGIARAGNTTMTQTGSVLGTAHYVSPEQAQGRKLTPASDLYSLGVVLYEASTGKLPFDADTPVAVALKQVNEEPKPPRLVNPSVPANLEAVIMKAMAKSPEDRYKTADEMRTDLLAVAQGKPVKAPGVIAGAAAAAAAGAVAAGGAPPPDQTAVIPQVGGTGRGAQGAAAAKGGTVKQVSGARKRRWPWALIAVALVAAGLASAWYFGAFQPKTTPVPEVTKLAADTAEARLIEAGLVVGKVTAEFSTEIEKGFVISQSPEAGEQVDPGSAVDLVVSKGLEMVKVPDVVGKSDSEAAKTLEDAGFDVKLPTSEFSDKPEGTVLSQEPKAGAQVEKGASVSFVVSKGRELKSVPDVVDKPLGTATGLVKKAGFKLSTSEAYSDTIGKGRVISQSPAGGQPAYVGSTVSIVVSLGKETLPVPDVINETEADATKKLKDAGFEVRVEYTTSPEDGIVLTQDPIPGTEARRGATVTITVGQAPSTEPPPANP